MLETPLTGARANDRSLPLDPARGRAELQRRLRKLQAVFDFGSIRSGRVGEQEVRDYYSQCHAAYRKYHSADGAVHMALNDGPRFDADGFGGQLRLIEQRWRERAPQRVLELGFGQGFNLEQLASRHRGVRFEGIDLTPAHVELAEKRMRDAGLSNVSLQLGDFSAMPYADASVDEVFAIEVLCHASDLPLALGEAARVLRAGGVLTLFDGYLLRPPQRLDEQETLAVGLVARGMAVDRLQTLGELLSAAQAAGFAAQAQTALDRQVMPTLGRLERTTEAVIRWPWLARRALAKRAPALGRNVLAGVLMRTAVSLGLIGYRRIVLQKESQAR